MSDSLPWVALLLLGAGHGINPAMGWLFAVARGMQERTAYAVWYTLLPLALGHALAIATVLVLAVLLGRLIPLHSLNWLVAATLLGFGVFRLYRHRHPRWGGMRVGVRDLTIWSFLMASAHGAGLMVLPFVLRADASSNGEHRAPAHDVGATASTSGGYTDHMGALASDFAGEYVVGVAATLIHTSGYLLVTGLVGVVVYRKLGLRLLGKAWLNLDRIWAVALIATAALTPLLRP